MLASGKTAIVSKATEMREHTKGRSAYPHLVFILHFCCNLINKLMGQRIRDIKPSIKHFMLLDHTDVGDH